MDISERNDGRYTCRLFVGGIAPGVKNSDLEKIFGKYGELLDVFINRHFAFIQYNEREAAEAALEGENGKTYFSSRFDIQFAKKPKHELQDAGGPQRFESQTRRWGPYDKRDDYFDNRESAKGYEQQSLKPIDKRDGKFGISDAAHNRLYDSYQEPFSNYQSGLGGGRGRYPEGPSADAYSSFGVGYRDRCEVLNSANRVPGNPTNNYERPQSISSYNSYSNMKYSEPVDSFERSYRGGYEGGVGTSYGSGGHLYSAPLDPQRNSDSVAHADRTNDIEIICEKALRSYGEYIENELKKSQFLVDVLFPEGGVPIVELLNNISSRGTLYAIVVNHYHEQNNLLDLHVLHGTRKVLENTPLNRAVDYLVSNFADFNSKPTRKPRNILPEQVMLLLKRLVESQCFLNYNEYEVLANYFTQQKVKLEPPAVSAPPVPKGPWHSKMSSQVKAVPPPSTQIDLEKRILSILNKKTESSLASSLTPTHVHENAIAMKVIDNIVMGMNRSGAM